MMQFDRGFRGLACVAAVLVLAVPAQAATERLLRASDAGLHRVDATRTTDDGTATALRMVTPTGQELELLLESHEALMGDARAHLGSVQVSRTQLYAGTVATRPGSWVRLARIGGAWLGAVHDGSQLWFLDPASHHRTLAARMGLDGNATLVYTLADLAQPLDFHGDTVPVPLAADGPSAPRMPSATQGSPAKELRVTLVMDTEFQQLYEAPASVALALLNIVDGFYAAQVDTRLRLHQLVALTDNGPLTSTDTYELLQALGAFVRDNDIPFHGIAHLLSGKDFDGGMVGYAFIDALCKPGLGYGINQMDRTTGGNAAVLAHEIAHNFGVRHDNEISLELGLTSAFVSENCNLPYYIMRPTIPAVSPPTEFSVCSMTWFDHYAPRNQACLEPLGLPFGNGFETQVLTTP